MMSKIVAEQLPHVGQKFSQSTRSMGQKVFADFRCQKFSQSIGVKSFRRPTRGAIYIHICIYICIYVYIYMYMSQNLSQTKGVKSFRRACVSKVFAESRCQKFSQSIGVIGAIFFRGVNVS